MSGAVHVPLLVPAECAELQPPPSPGKPGVQQYTGSQRAEHDSATEEQQPPIMDTSFNYFEGKGESEVAQLCPTLATPWTVTY